MLRYLADPEGFMRGLERYGDVALVPSIGPPLIIVSSPEGIRSIFGADPDTFTPFAADAMVSILGRGSVLLQSGAPHRRSRKLLAPPFHGARMRTYAEAMAEAATSHLAEAPRGHVFDIEEVFRKISLDVILRTIFGVTIGERRERCRRAILDTVRAFIPPLAVFSFLRRNYGGMGPWARFRRRQDETHALFREEIARRRSSPHGEDILSMLTAARDENGQSMDDQEIIEQLFTMVMAGHETTATALAWAVDDVFRHPELATQLRDQLKDCAGNVEKMASLPLLDGVCSETLRMHPLIPTVARKLVQPFTVGGYVLPAGVGVAANVYAAHFSPTVFPEPHEYRPQRFMEGRNYAPNEYFPWGGGARRCLGAAFASYEMKIVLATLLTSTHIELVAKSPPRVGARAATIGPKGGVRVRLLSLEP